jgi:hypothetical protein
LRDIRTPAMDRLSVTHRLALIESP